MLFVQHLWRLANTIKKEKKKDTLFDLKDVGVLFTPNNGGVLP